MQLVADCFGVPNGLVFSADESELYVSDTRAGFIRVFDVREFRLAYGESPYAYLRRGCRRVWRSRRPDRSGIEKRRSPSRT